MLSQNDWQIINGIINYISSSTDPAYKNWYVGIASDPKSRLFSDHQVKEVGDYWIYDKCLSSDCAREIELYFTNNLKTDGNPGGGDNSTIYIYAYLKKVLY